MFCCVSYKCTMIDLVVNNFSNMYGLSKPSACAPANAIIGFQWETNDVLANLNILL